jgi:hypothetical protein
VDELLLGLPRDGVAVGVRGGQRLPRVVRIDAVAHGLQLAPDEEVVDDRIGEASARAERADVEALALLGRLRRAGRG